MNSALPNDHQHAESIGSTDETRYIRILPRPVLSPGTSTTGFPPKVACFARNSPEFGACPDFRLEPPRTTANPPELDKALCQALAHGRTLWEVAA
jgi:hypothetical protein